METIVSEWNEKEAGRAKVREEEDESHAHVFILDDSIDPTGSKHLVQLCDQLLVDADRRDKVSKVKNDEVDSTTGRGRQTLDFER